MTVERDEQPFDPWLTTAEAAGHAKVSEATILDNAQRGRLSGVKTVPGAKKAHWRFRRSDVDAWLESGRVPTGRPRGSRRPA